MNTGPVVIVGAGQAGGRAAQALRRAGHEGAITLVGDEACGPYERPPLSKDILLGKASVASLHLLPQAGWSDIGVDLRCGASVAAIDREARSVHLHDGSTLPYAALVLATGARARAWSGTVEAGAQVAYLRTIEDAERLRPWLAPGRRVAIVGAGFIGLELAASARALGAEVCVIESAPRPLTRLLPADFSAWLTALHVSHGVTFRFGANVAALHAQGVRLHGGEEIAADVVVVGIGAVPNDELAAAAGLAVRDGILVDALGRTADAAVFAIGDVARHLDEAAGIDARHESWRNAEDQALAVASAICGTEPPPRHPPWFWTDQYGHNIQLSGRPQDGLTRVDRGTPGDGPYLAYYLDGDVVRGVIGVDCGREVRGAQRLIRDAAAVDAATLPGPRVKPRSAVPG